MLSFSNPGMPKLESSGPNGGLAVLSSWAKVNLVSLVERLLNLTRFRCVTFNPIFSLPFPKVSAVSAKMGHRLSAMITDFPVEKSYAIPATVELGGKEATFSAIKKEEAFLFWPDFLSMC